MFIQSLIAGRPCSLARCSRAGDGALTYEFVGRPREALESSEQERA